MKLNDNYTIIAGIWPENFFVSDFLDCAGMDADANSQNKFQLFQTYSECGLEYFKPDTLPDSKYLEQYRAFCQEWEMWIRNKNSKELRFRFICKKKQSAKEVIEKLSEKGCTSANNISVNSIEVIEDKYPLWGKPLEKGEYNPEGWYTERIPQIIKYPVKFPEKPIVDKKVFLFVENFVKEDGSVELVRYVGLDVKAG